jgi:quercetin dioxygenase-like cupin family protein
LRLQRAPWSFFAEQSGGQHATQGFAGGRRFDFGRVGRRGGTGVPGLYAGGWSSLLHVWTDAGGVSHAEHLVISKDVKPVPVTQMSIRPGTRGFVDWHNSRFPAFVITIEGDLEVEVSDGTRLALPPSKVAFLEDNGGKGHITRTHGVVNLFIAVTPGFDVRKWASGQA